jgi:enoyl-CoA hydratase/carnithine racemase
VTLIVDRGDDGVAVLTLDVPERRNAMTAELTAAWRDAMGTLAADTGVRAVVVTGAGPAFCAGGDLSWIGAGNTLSVAEIRDRMLPFYRTWLAVRELEVPVLAAVNGPAVGAGLALALACDLRYAAENAVFSAPFTQLGMSPGMATSYLLQEAVGLPVARELLLTGRRVDAAEALRLGLVNGVYTAMDLVAEVRAVAARIAAGAPLPVRLTTTALRTGFGSLEEALAWEALAQPVTMASEDLREGLAAQREKRAPRFTGR